MSYKLLYAAWRHRLAPASRIVLMALADRTNEKTGRCDPSIPTLALDCSMSVRSVQAVISELEAAGTLIIERRFNSSSAYKLNLEKNDASHQEEAGLTPANPAPALPQNLHRPSGKSRTTPPAKSADTPANSASGVVQNLPKGGAESAYKPRNSNHGKEEPKKDASLELTSGHAVVPSKSRFEEFWAAFPRKVAPGAAKAAYAKALRKVTHEVIMAGIAATAWKADQQFNPHPTTWLNQERWVVDANSEGVLDGVKVRGPIKPPTMADWAVDRLDHAQTDEELEEQDRIMRSQRGLLL